jgi:uncharacterized protein YbbK (DUF523 family)
MHYDYSIACAGCQGGATTYDGTHSGHLVPGEGVTVALLRRARVRAVSEEEVAP